MKTGGSSEYNPLNIIVLFIFENLHFLPKKIIFWNYLSLFWNPDIIFQEKNEAEPLSILKEDVGKIMISEGVISKKENELKESKFNWYSVPCLFLVAVISMLTLISQDGFPGFP